MKEETAEGTEVERHLWMVAAAVAVLAAGLVFAAWTVKNSDVRLREDLLGRARLAALSIDPQRVQALAGTPADASRPEYLTIKNDLAVAREVFPRCRFLYLMGRRPGGGVFFYADSEPFGSEEESPPGQPYPDATPALRSVFESGEGITEGPVADDWGNWVSALVPVGGSNSGRPAAILGIDVDAGDWKGEMLREAVVPVSAALILVLVLLGVRAYLHRQSVYECERKRMEGETRRLATIAEQAVEGIAVADMGGTLQFANRSWALMHGYERPEDLIGKPLSTFHSAEQMVREVEPFNEEVKRQGQNVGEVGHRRRDGSTFPTMMTSTILRDAQGRPCGLAGSALDITDRKRAELELQRSNRHLQEAIARANEMTIRAEKASRAKSEFLANMSHEIRTPLNGVIGMAGLLLDTAMTAEQADYTETLRRSAEALLDMINDVLDFSKIEAGKMELETIDFDLHTCLEDVGDMLAHKAQQKGLDLAVVVHGNLPAGVRGDPARLRQVLINLVSNGIKFTERGEVVVRASLAALSETSQTVRFEVSDTGIGIPEDRQGGLFEAFWQVDASTTRKYGGSGLGLAISRRIVEAMGGAMGVESRVGEGTRVRFTAVFGRPGEQGAGGEAEPERDPRMRGIRVLVADAHAASRSAFREELERCGCRVEEAGDGSRALAMLRAAAAEGEPYRLALIDLRLSGTNARELGERAQAGPGASGTALILVAPVSGRGEAAALLERGFAALVTRPVRRDRLREAVSTAMGACRSEHGGGPGKAAKRPFQGTAAAPRFRVLLVEDNVVNQKVAARMLEKAGVRCDLAVNGKEGVEAFFRARYDLVLMDCQMPVADGFQAAEAIRQREGANRRTPIIAMTANAMKGDRERCLQAGMDDYLTKPVTPSALERVLERYLSGEPSAGRGGPDAGPGCGQPVGDPGPSSAEGNPG